MNLLNAAVRSTQGEDFVRVKAAQQLKATILALQLNSLKFFNVELHG